jgi:hypothetical protein
MNTCSLCAMPFFPQSSAWGQICGQCIAARIEMSLMPGGLHQAHRKPLRRAVEGADVNEGWPGLGLPVPRQRAAGN